MNLLSSVLLGGFLLSTQGVNSAAALEAPSTTGEQADPASAKGAAVDPIAAEDTPPPESGAEEQPGFRFRTHLGVGFPYWSQVIPSNDPAVVDGSFRGLTPMVFVGVHPGYALSPRLRLGLQLQGAIGFSGVDDNSPTTNVGAPVSWNVQATLGLRPISLPRLELSAGLGYAMVAFSSDSLPMYVENEPPGPATSLQGPVLSANALYRPFGPRSVLALRVGLDAALLFERGTTWSLGPSLALVLGR